jgi:hypothetical protein
MNDGCTLLKKYIDSRNGKVTYKQCFCYLNNGTYMSQIDIYTCLEKFFPGAAFKIHKSWTGIM